MDLLRFEARPDQELLLRARWVIRERSGGDRVWSGGGTIRRPLADPGIEKLVAAHEEDLGELADAIASPLAEVAGSPAGAPSPYESAGEDLLPRSVGRISVASKPGSKEGLQAWGWPASPLA